MRYSVLRRIWRGAGPARLDDRTFWKSVLKLGGMNDRGKKDSRRQIVNDQRKESALGHSQKPSDRE